MHTIKLTIAYDGTGYNGWQLQPRGRTVQGELEKAVRKVFGGIHRVYGASRTDAGVHARAQAAHFRSAVSIPEKNIATALNSALPRDISVTHSSYAGTDFHAQFSARSKRYVYTILASQRRDPFAERYAWRLGYKMDVSLMRKEARALVGKHDFKAFQASDKKERSSVREILSLAVKKKGSLILIEAEGTGFLYNMVRNIAGTLVDIGRGYLPAGSMKKILNGKDRTLAGPTAPAMGLCLVEVRY